MNEALAAAARLAYRGVGRLLAPLSGTYLQRRARRGKEEVQRLGERRGVASAPRPDGRLIWIHAASIGESAAVAPLARALKGQGFSILLTTGTVTSARIVSDRLAGIVTHQYVPLDVAPYMARFLTHWQPDLAILAESEIWPVMLGEIDRRDIPLALVNARLSDRSFQRWRKLPTLARSLFRTATVVAAQSHDDAERLRSLGAARVVVTGNLKSEIAAEAPAASISDPLASAIADRPVWAAISTHPGEEAMAFRIHDRLAVQYPGLLTIVVPRHVERATAIRTEAETVGLSVLARTDERALTDETAVFLGNTTGEIGLYLALSGIVFMGKSLMGAGGQNPLEAAHAGKAILSGPHVGNFSDIYRRLSDAGAVEIVANELELTQALDRLLADKELRRSRAKAANAALKAMEGPLAATLQALEPLLSPIRPKENMS